MKLTITSEFQQFLETIGLDIEIVLKDAGVANKLWQEEIKLTSVEYYNMLEEIDKNIDDETIISLSDINNIKMFMPPLFAALSAENGVEAIKRFSKFKNLIGPVELDYIISKTTVNISFNYVHKQQNLPRFSILNEQLLLLSLIRTGLGKNLTPLLVESQYEYSKEIEKIFGMKPQKAEYNQIVFDKEEISKKFKTQNNLMWKYLEPELNRQLALVERDNSFSNYVQKEVLEVISSGNYSAEVVAGKLGISTRTLQRNLSAENTTYKAEVQKIQKSLTFSYLSMKLSTDEIAYLVGYSETTAFLRAFKTWTGMTLTQYKEKSKVE